MSLPAADELFRTTGGAAVQASSSREDPGDGDDPTAPDATTVPAPAEAPEGPASREGVGARPAVAPTAESVEPAVPGQGKRPSAPGTRPATGSGPPGARSGGAPRAGGRGAAETPRRGRAPRRPSGRERHDEKITVYVSAEELMDLEHARLVLRGEHGLAVDRGRIVREAVAVVLADLESRGDASILVRRLSAG
ncbi:hypothetical protein [Streptomyces sp. ST2-7A]|uniref:hypothetical protein n=1 Tax=Streptomyces sp. ST2-7A TaxID=2907214 RepID=UPI001F3E31C7|nr:hypothetical protein [Streptomyces sp. ST2-7A]MCE7080804.1 hypothetical protein [Streptomyces sp. ST2-7A]